MRDILSFLRRVLKGLFWEKAELVAQIEALQAGRGSSQQPEQRHLTPEEHLSVLGDEIVEAIRVCSGRGEGELIPLLNQLRSFGGRTVQVWNMRSDVHSNELQEAGVQFLSEVLPVTKGLTKRLQDAGKYEEVRSAVAAYYDSIDPSSPSPRSDFLRDMDLVFLGQGGLSGVPPRSLSNLPFLRLVVKTITESVRASTAVPA